MKIKTAQFFFHIPVDSIRINWYVKHKFYFKRQQSKECQICPCQCQKFTKYILRVAPKPSPHRLKDSHVKMSNFTVEHV